MVNIINKFNNIGNFHIMVFFDILLTIHFLEESSKLYETYTQILKENNNKVRIKRIKLKILLIFVVLIAKV